MKKTTLFSIIFAFFHDYLKAPIAHCENGAWFIVDQTYANHPGYFVQVSENSNGNNILIRTFEKKCISDVYEESKVQWSKHTFWRIHNRAQIELFKTIEINSRLLIAGAGRQGSDVMPDIISW